MSEKKRFNVYEILELDIGEKSITNIRKRLEERKRIWSKWKNQGTPKQKAKAEDYFDWLLELEKVISNKEQLEKDRLEYLKREKEKKEEFYKTLDEMIGFLSDKNISDETYKTFLKRFKGKLEQSDIDSRLKKKKFTVGEEKGSSKQRSKKSKSTLESSEAKDIAERINELEKRDLYDFLGLHKNSSLKCLQERAKEMWSDSQGKTDTLNTRISQLAGRSKTIFSSKEKKEKYDNILSLSNLTSLDHILELAGSDGILTEGEISKLLIAGKKYGISIDDSREYIEEKAYKRKWKILGEKTFEPPKLLECGFCGELADNENQERCKKCNEKLIQPCPLCNTLTPTEQSACSKCDCTTGDAPKIQRMMQNVKVHIDDQKFEEAKKGLHTVLQYWPKWKVATEELSKIKKLLSQKQEEYQSIIDLSTQRKYFSASKALSKYIQKYGNIGTLKIISEIDVHTKKASQHFLEAEKYRLSKQYDRAIGLYDSALSQAIDYDAAKDALAKIPLPLPEDVVGKVINGKLSISWTSHGKNEKIAYTVLRKEDSIPKNAIDGKEIAKEIFNTSVVDNAVDEGRIYYYSIFPVRNGVAYNKGKEIGPYMVPGDTTFDYSAGDGQVTIDWKIPLNADMVEVWKKEGKNPFKRGEGIKISAVKNTLIDTDVVNDKAYTYLLVTCYRDPSKHNQFLYSEGVSIVATPTSVPEEVKDLRVEMKDIKVFLAWSPIKASVMIRQLDKKPTLQQGEVLSLEKVEKIGVAVSIVSATTAQTTIKSQGNIYFLPFSIKHQTAVVGKVVKITTIKDVQNLQAQQVGQKVVLTFVPPVGAKSFWVSYRYDRFTKKPNENSTINRQYSINEYKRNKQLEIKIDQSKKHYITVYTYDEKEKLYSNGAEVLESCGNQEIVKYGLEYTKSFFLRKIEGISVVLEAKTHNLLLQDITIVFKGGSVPLTRDDGVVIKNMKKVSFEEGKAKIRIPEKFWNEKGYIKLFFKNNEDGKDIRLLPAAEQKLKIK